VQKRQTNTDEKFLHHSSSTIWSSAQVYFLNTAVKIIRTEKIR